MNDQCHLQCNCPSATTSVYQTLDEMTFERGIWSAALSGQVDEVKKCLTKGGDCVNSKDKYGYTALHYAARNGHCDICSLLLVKGSDVNATTNSSSSTPLHRAAFMGHCDIVSLLLQCGASAYLVDSDGRTALHKGAQGGHCEVLKVLLCAAPSCKSLKDFHGQLPFDLVSCDELRHLLAEERCLVDVRC